jgi:O-methyltransferase domain
MWHPRFAPLCPDPFATIADIGGGRGHLLRAILKGSPKTQGILFDQPHVVAEVSAAPGEFSVVGGNFFADPMPHADAYLLMNIIHDWADAESTAPIILADHVQTGNNPQRKARRGDGSGWV